MKSIIFLVGLAAISAGCKKHHEDEAAAPSTMANTSMSGSANGSAMAGAGSAGSMAAGSAAPGAGGPTATPPATAAPDLPTSVDFEEQALKEVTESNLEAKLTDLEKQLAN